MLDHVNPPEFERNAKSMMATVGTSNPDDVREKRHHGCTGSYCPNQCTRE